MKSSGKIRLSIILLISGFCALILNTIGDLILESFTFDLLWFQFAKNLIHLVNLFGSVVASYYLVDKFLPSDNLASFNSESNDLLENSDLTEVSANRKKKHLNHDGRLSAVELTISRKPSESESVFPSFLSTSFSLNKFPTLLLDGIGLLLFVYIPLDCLSYVFPDLLEYSTKIFDADSVSPENYFLFSFGKMILFTLVFNFFVAMREEFIFRSYFLNSGKIYLRKGETYIISASAFGFAHFMYIFIDTGFSFLYPIYWGFNAFIVGAISAWYMLKKGNLWPLIFAHIINNTISSVAIRFYALDKPFWTYTAPFLYGPFILVTIFLYIKRFKDVKRVIGENVSFFKDYIQSGTAISEKLLDLGLIGLLLLTSIFLIGS